MRLLLAIIAALCLSIPAYAQDVSFNIFGNPESPLQPGDSFTHHWAVGPYEFGKPQDVEAVLIATYPAGLTITDYQVSGFNKQPDWRCAHIGQIVCVADRVRVQSDLLVTVRVDGQRGAVYIVRGLWVVDGSIFVQTAPVRVAGSTLYAPMVRQ